MCSVLLLFAGPASAVIGGTDDTANRFADVGALQLQFEGAWFDFCLGTLIADNVVLTWPARPRRSRTPPRTRPARALPTSE